MAFLYGYKGNLKTASRHYKQASLSPVEAISLGQIEDFMCWVLEEEPHAFQLYYCLGLFNWKAKGDTAQASLDFEKFLTLGAPIEYSKERELATQWMRELEAAS